MPFLLGHVVVELRDIDNKPVVRMGVPDDWPELDKQRKVGTNTELCSCAM